MKKQLLLFWAIMLAVTNAMSQSYDFSAQAPSGQILFYDIEGSTVTVTGCNAATGALVIPNSVTYGATTYPVTGIGNFAFSGCTGLDSVTLPTNSVLTIGNSAFYGCTGLTEVTLPNMVVSVGEHAFHGCSGLTKVTIGCNVTSIGAHAFYGCSSLSEVDYTGTIDHWCRISFGDASSNPASYVHTLIINGVPVAGDIVITYEALLGVKQYAFYEFTGLTSVTIGDYLTSIGNYAFYGCTGLTEVTLPESMTGIGSHAFSGCSSLTEVTIPDAVTNLGSHVFFGCTGLTEVTLGNSLQGILTSVFEGCTNLAEVTIPNSVKGIGLYAFKGCIGLTSVTIGNSVKTIGDEAFYGCGSLEEVTIPTTVTHVGPNAFYGSGLGSITFKNPEPPTMGSDAFGPLVDNITVYVPCGSSASYEAALPYLSHFAEKSPLFAAWSEDEGQGSVQVLSTPSCTDQTAVLLAVPDDGYHFDHWSNGGTTNPDTLHLVGDSSVTAFFAPNRYTLTLLSDDVSLGTVCGSGEYNYLDTVTITATATEHCYFVQWSDGNDGNPRQYVISGDDTLTAYFAIDTHTVCVQSDDTAMGSATVNGNSAATVFYGDIVTIMAIAYDGYRFVRWDDNDTHSVRTVTVTADTTYTAYFEEVVQGITDVDGEGIRVYVAGGRICVSVDGEIAEEFRVYDLLGREVFHATHADETSVLPTGVYLVRIGDLPARRVVVGQ